MFPRFISNAIWSCLFSSRSISFLFWASSFFILSTPLTLFWILLWFFIATSVVLSTVKMAVVAVSTLACTCLVSSLASSDVSLFFFLRIFTMSSALGNNCCTLSRFWFLFSIRIPSSFWLTTCLLRWGSSARLTTSLSISSISPPRFWAPTVLVLTVTGSEMSNFPSAIDCIILASPIWLTMLGSPHIIWLSWMNIPPLSFLFFLLPSATSGSEAILLELFTPLRCNFGLLQNFVPSGIPNSANAPFLYLKICFNPARLLMLKTSHTTLFNGSMSIPTFHWTLFMTVDLVTSSGNISQNSLRNLTPPVARSSGDWRTMDITPRILALRHRVLSSLLYRM